MESHPNACHSRYLNNNGSCPRFAVRIPDSTCWFMGTLQQHSLLVEFTNQIVWWRAGCSHLDFMSGFDANPPQKVLEVQLCLQVCWLTCGCGSIRGHGIGWCCNEVKANDLDVQNLTNTWVVKKLQLQAP